MSEEHRPILCRISGAARLGAAALAAVALWPGGAGTSLLGAQTASAASTVQVAAAQAVEAPAAAFTATDGRSLSVADFRGHPTMVWLVSSWCGSCAAGMQTLVDHEAELETAGLKVLVLRNYQNLGYPGPNIEDFVRQTLSGGRGRGAAIPQNWVLGQATQAFDHVYNTKHYPDIYYLVDADGRIQAVDGAPSATLDQILSFAHENAKKGVSG